MTSLRSLTSALLAAALLALAGCGGGRDAAPAVPQAPAARIEIAPSTVLLTAPGARKGLTAKVFDAAGNPLTTSVEWTSSRPALVTVDAAGVVTAAGTGGSSQVTARIGTLASPPLLVVHTTVPAGTVLVNDANISGDPVETNPDAPPGVGNTYVVRLVDVAAPKVGDLLMNTEAKVVAGRVISVETTNGVHTVTLGLPPAREMFPNLAIDEVIDLNLAEIAFPAEVQDRFDIKREGNTFTFAPKPGKFDLSSAAPASRSQAQASGRERPLAVLSTRSLGPFECNGVVDGAAGAGSLPLAITVPPAFTIAVNPRLDVVSTLANGFERVVLRTEPNFSADWGLKALFAFEGKITCEAKLFEIKIPIGGPLALIIGGQFPVGVGLEVGGKLTALSMGITWKASAKTTVDVGLACPGGTNCDVVKAFGPLETSVVPTYDVPLLTDLRLEPSVSTYAFVEAAIGNPFLKSLRFKAFKAKAGAALKGNFASQAIQVADPLYSSDYKLVSELKAGADTGFIGFAGFLGLNAIAETVLEVSADLGNSPTGTVTADVAEFNLDDTVNFTVKLDSRKADFIPLIGPYNVERIVLVRRDASLNATEVASVAAMPGQTEFSIPFKSTSLATGRTNEFFAFVVTKLLPSVLPPLELGQASVVERALFAYVANSGSNNVSAYSINASTGVLTPVGVVAAGTQPTSVTVDPSGKFAYVANASSSDVSAYSINASTGALTSVGAAVAAGNTPVSVTVDPSGKFAYVANQGSNNVSAYSINASTGVLTSVGEVAGAGIIPSTVTVDPSGKFAYVANQGVGNDQSFANVSAYSINASTGVLTPIGVVAAGTAPFSVTVDPSGKFAYVANASSNDVSAYRINASTGALTRVGAAVAAGTTPFSVTVDPSGKFAYVANFVSNNVSAYSINVGTGALTPVGAVAAGTNPRFVTVDPSGKFAYVANFVSNNVSAYSINVSTGALTPVGAVAAGTFPASITTTGKIK